jgi:predicted aspartyl protease/uncharacterized protein YecT (DUF1311 family)
MIVRDLCRANHLDLIAKRQRRSRSAARSATRGEILTNPSYTGVAPRTRKIADRDACDSAIRVAGRTFKMRLLILPIILLAALTGSEAAMAFNCSGITLPSSIVICSDSDLTRRADERQQIYNETRSRLTPDQQNALWEDQKAWVRSYAAACGVPPDNPSPIPIPPSVIECFKRSAEERASYLRSYGMSGSVASTAAAQPSSAPSESKTSDIDEVALVQAGQLFEIPVRINGAIILNFIIDSGASDVQIPFDVFSTLVRANTIEKSDLIGEQTYVLADGSKQKYPKFLIRELKIGNQILRNVPGSVGSSTGSLLLGQSFLSHFDEWTLDNKRHVLKLIGTTTETNEVASSASSRVQPGPIASLSAPTFPRNEQPSAQSAVLCGKPIEYAIEQSGGSTGFVGVWAGNWNNAARLCGALIVQGIDAKGAVDVIYVYGPSRPDTGLSWKQQHRVAVLSNGTLSFQDDQGSTFRFRPGGPDVLDAIFMGGTGRLTGTFQKSR